MVMQFLKFGLVGVLNTSMHYAIFFLLFSFFGLHYMMSSAIGYASGLLNSYFLNRIWTFRSRYCNKKKEFAKFVFVNGVSLGVNLAVLKLLVVYGALQPEMAQIIAILFSMTANFAGNRFWTFNSSSGA